MKYPIIILSFFTLLSCGSEESKEEPQSVEPKENPQKNMSESDQTNQSKRIPAKFVDPITHNGIEYQTELNEVIAKDLNSNKELWRKKVYEIEIDDNLETDVQDIHIDSMQLIFNRLKIRNEDGKWFYFDINNIEVLEFENDENQKSISIGEKELTIQPSTKEVFNFFNFNATQSTIIENTTCFELGLASQSDKKEITLKTSNNNQFKLIDDSNDEQFKGYELLHFDSILNSYILWESWIEAGHPIAVNASNGVKTKVFGKTFYHDQEKNVSINIADDIDSGWTPNGIQCIEHGNGELKVAWQFDPTFDMDESIGPLDLAWIDHSTIVVKFRTLNAEENYTTYKTIQF